MSRRRRDPRTLCYPRRVEQDVLRRLVTKNRDRIARRESSPEIVKDCDSFGLQHFSQGTIREMVQMQYWVEYERKFSGSGKIRHGRFEIFWRDVRHRYEQQRPRFRDRLEKP